MQVKNWDLHKERKNIRERINEDKMNTFISLIIIDLTGRSLFKTITATIYNDQLYVK